MLKINLNTLKSFKLNIGAASRTKQHCQTNGLLTLGIVWIVCVAYDFIVMLCSMECNDRFFIMVTSHFHRFSALCNVLWKQIKKFSLTGACTCIQFS